jgi:hypothetical protein
MLPALMIDPDELGPKMAALTENQQRFVRAMVLTGGQDHTKAARLAGYVGTEEALRVTAYRNTHKESITEAMKEEAARMFAGGAILGAAAIVEIARDPQHKDRLKAAMILTAYAGLAPSIQVRHTHEHTATGVQETIKAIVALANRTGQDARLLLGNAGVIVDADFKVVKEPGGNAAESIETVAAEIEELNFYPREDEDNDPA